MFWLIMVDVGVTWLEVVVVIIWELYMMLGKMGVTDGPVVVKTVVEVVLDMIEASDLITRSMECVCRCCSILMPGLRKSWQTGHWISTNILNVGDFRVCVN